MRFVDLFCGLGGFHIALRELGHRCVFACEIDDTLRALYQENFEMVCEGDIREIAPSDIPAHDILCAGFPCQPFSKAGGQVGFKDRVFGDLYINMLQVIRHHRPRYLILENVPNFERHKNGMTWNKIKRLLRKEGYHVDIEKLSPHRYGIPQIRERIFIVASLEPLNHFKWPEATSTHAQVSIRTMLDSDPTGVRRLPVQVKKCLAIWQEFLDGVPKTEKIPHPLWSMEFGATYPYKRTTPSMVSVDNLRNRYKGSHGRRLTGAKTREEVLDLLPSHARAKQKRFPSWKIQFIRKNRDFYERHKSWLDDWLQKIRDFPSSFQKLEWNCQERDPRNEVRRLDQYIIQIRPSGVRVKRPNTAPALVAMNTTQVPIIGWEERYMTPTECQRLQSMDEIDLPDKDGKAYAALGNAISVKVARLVAHALVGRASLLDEVNDSLTLMKPIATINRRLEIGLAHDRGSGS